MPLTILSVAYPFARVSPGCVGGAEEIVRTIDAGITARGHRSIVIAQEGSSIGGLLVPIPRFDGSIDTAAREWAARMTSDAIGYVLRHWMVDVIHLHSVDFIQCLIPTDAAQIATLHLPIDWYPSARLRNVAHRVQLVCVSSSQQRDATSAGLASEVIENGVAMTPSLSMRRRPYVAALGRICSEKSFHEALDAARLADRDLMLAGCTFPIEAHRRYFHTEILPRLDARRRFIGPVNVREKTRLLARARCVLISSRVAETSSLVAMEALAVGTPVIAFPSGALAAIVEHGHTGFLVNDARAMADAIAAVDVIDPEDCRTAAAVRFSAERMVDQYFGCYERTIERRTRSVECA